MAVPVVGGRPASRTRVLRSETDDGRFARASASPDPRLDGIVARPHSGVLQDSLQPARWLAAAIPVYSLIVSLAEPVRIQTADLPADWLGGLSDTYDVVEIPPRHGSLDFKLTPLGAFAVLGIPLSELGGGFVSLEDLFGPPGRQLGDDVREADRWADRFDLVEAFLLRRAAAGPRPTPIVAHAWSLIALAEGRLRIAELAATVGCSRRYLAARFRDEVGLTPKSAARIVRFAAVRRRLEASPGRFAEIAQTCGYCDQAHLNRDFRELGGTTPSDFLASRSASGRRPDQEGHISPRR
jgi:AraC-like DNA-binding protein